jgi:hypothetical protein
MWLFPRCSVNASSHFDLFGGKAVQEGRGE